MSKQLVDVWRTGIFVPKSNIVDLTKTKDADTTPLLITRQTSQIALKKGDWVQVSAREEFTNPNTTARYAYNISGVQSEHWSLWVMAAIGIKMVDVADPAKYRWVRRPTAENWDNLIHHKSFDVMDWWHMTEDQLVTFSTQVNFASSAVARIGVPAVIIEQGFGVLNVAVYRDV